MSDRQFQPREALDAFVEATHWWVEDVLPGAVGQDLDRPGLGVWTVGELIAHTSRAFTTIVDYVDPATAAGEDLLSASAYLRAGLSAAGSDEAVARRGKEEAAELGDVIGAALERADAALQTVGTTLPTATARSRFGDLRVDQFLVTRVVELTVHGLDLAAAIDVDVTPPGSALSMTLAVLAECVANDADASSSLVLALTGRRDLAAGFTVFGHA